ncbi:MULTISPECIES: U32 family peptidase [unclassified Fusibacter]|uniref:peptidase U32 family protein n=1 Tax=unclassified Fusibacter TaxID=2624464 RepID=UPI0010110006|nr:MULTISPECIES: U32 family peptidase [unclassified Fusibacter]MCK8058712.1 U32 family peptidase [Fusibacter sp. A2]NPE21786.1 U32 family peptidase [Fusibacter sp. A1]RXV61359.1 U32 family peptidase [Fusibacter sp. A1]
MHELLAPVGNFEMLMAAIDGGADAVFLSGPQYGARAKQANFSEEDLIKAIEIAHDYDVSVMVTLNTLIKEHEFEACKTYIGWLYEIGVDALIVQDLGVINYARTAFKDMELHGSTQMAVYDINGVKAAKALGLSRVVVARETPLSVVKEMLGVEGIELEVFVHGALCYGYSGQCLLSSVQGGRSGNRGQCAQPCRLKYSLDGSNPNYAMSMKDLSTIDGIDALKALDIACFKIEGRLRHPDYVYHTVKAYRSAIDGVGDELLDTLKDKMFKAFNRDYTGGHLLNDSKKLNFDLGTNKGEYIGKTLESRSKFKLKIKLENAIYKGDGLKIIIDDHSKGIEVFNIYTKEGVKTSAEEGEYVEIDFNGKVGKGCVVFRTRSAKLTEDRLEAGAKKMPLALRLTVDNDLNMTLHASAYHESVSVTSPEKAQIANNRPADKESLRQNLEKLGGTPFKLVDFEFESEHELFIPKSVVNELRRLAIDELLRIHRMRYLRVLGENVPQETIVPSFNEKVHCYVSSQEQIDSLQGILQVDLFSYDPALVTANDGVVSQAIRPFSNMISKLVNERAISVSNIGHKEVCSNAKIYDFHSTVMNGYAFYQLSKLGIEDITWSVELTADEVIRSIKKYGGRAFAYGKVPVMYTRTCPMKEKGQDCKTCEEHFTLRQKNHGTLHVTCANRVLQYLTEQPLVRNELWMEHAIPVSVFFTDETEVQIEQIIHAILNHEPLTLDKLNAYEQPIK